MTAANRTSASTAPGPAPAYAPAAAASGYEFSSGSGYALPEYPFVEPPELAAGQTLRHPVVIVGAGLTGLTLACALGQYGVPTLLLDEDNTVGVKGASSRGICYAQKTLEIFKRLGIYERIARKGVQWSVGRTFAGSREVYAFDLAERDTHRLSQQPPFINIQQFYVEGYLVEQLLAEHSGLVDIRWRHRITAFAQNADSATLTLATPSGSYQLEAEHVVDCSGAHSPFRNWCGAVVAAKKGDDRWCIADVRFKNPPPAERHTWIEAPFNEGRAVWQHLMADGVWRIDYQMPPNADLQAVSQEGVVRARLAAQFGGTLAPGDCDIVWVGPYAYRSECLTALRHGRVFFAGDAAHVVSPFGARGGNSGVQDADNLAWKLAAVAQGRAAPPLLDSYHTERHEAATHNVQVTNRTARFLRPADGAERLFRGAAISLASRHAFARALVNTGRMSVASHYSSCGPDSGRAVQNAGFQWANGRPGQLSDLQRWAGARCLLLVWGPLAAPARQRLAALSLAADVRCVQVLKALGPAAQEHVLDAPGHLAAACTGGAVSNGCWALLRPDGYLAATGPACGAGLVAAVGRALQAAPQSGAPQPPRAPQSP